MLKLTIDIEIVGEKPHPRLSPLLRGAEWDVYEAMFYSINVGLGVGYGQFQVVGSNGKMFTVAYCIMGARPVPSSPWPTNMRLGPCRTHS